MVSFRSLAFALVLSTGCETASETPPAERTVIPDDSVLQGVIDENPAPDAIDITLEARPGEIQYGENRPSTVWTYNGQIPGPFVEAKVGDTLTVRFTNRLPEPTTIHWHGIRLPAAMDGTLAMQDPIQPGETFVYSFTFKDAGLYWYHPHIRSDIQVQKGLYGAILVRAKDEPAVDQEKVLVLDDVRLKPDGSLSEFLDDEAKMMGREGNTLLVNGIESATLRTWPGALVRLRLVNVANGRFFNLRIPGVTLRVIGTDGGLIFRPYETDTLLMSPGERYDVLFKAPAQATTLPIYNEPYERGHDSGHAEQTTVAELVVEGEPSTGTIPQTSAEIERLTVAGAATVPIRLSEKFNEEGKLLFMINEEVHPDVPMVHAMSGETKVLELDNQSDMDHPFHLHGFFFQVLARNGEPEPQDALANKDTIIVPGRQKLTLAARLDEPGMWMYHCHILEHAEGGMMGELEVAP